ncbi:hypothetical protein I3843_01G044100 [Carya illinoinensis]|nr:hypothetical protein I3843_01G044100 [Carya illinoinensis]
MHAPIRLASLEKNMFSSFLGASIFTDCIYSLGFPPHELSTWTVEIQSQNLVIEGEPITVQAQPAPSSAAVAAQALNHGTIQGRNHALLQTNNAACNMDELSGVPQTVSKSITSVKDASCS